LALLLDAEILRPIVSEVIAMATAEQAFLVSKKAAPGKVVLRVLT